MSTTSRLAEFHVRRRLERRVLVARDEVIVAVGDGEHLARARRKRALQGLQQQAFAVRHLDERLRVCLMHFAGIVGR